MASRHRSRELAVQMIYQADLHPPVGSRERVIERFWREQALASADDRPFFEILAQGILDELPRVDKLIEDSLENWRMNRIEKVDLAVLRVATFEMFFSSDVEKPDAAVVINEAVEIAKKFGNKDSPSFVNGILDALAKRNPELTLSAKAKKEQKS